MKVFTCVFCMREEGSSLVVLLLFLLLLCLGRSQAQIITDESQLPIFTPYSRSFCTFTGSYTTYNAYASSIETNLTFDNSTGWSVTTYELCDPSTNVQKCNHQYQIEGVRILADGPECQTCPYHVDTWWKSHSPVSATGVLFGYHIIVKIDPDKTYTGEFNPMFGPCFDGQPSLQSVCMQHPALFPPLFVGTYHFAMQMPFPPQVANNSYFLPDSLAVMTIHEYLGQVIFFLFKHTICMIYLI